MTGFGARGRRRQGRALPFRLAGGAPDLNVGGLIHLVTGVGVVVGMYGTVFLCS